MDEAAKTIDLFKAKTCGSAYDLALININSFPSEQDLAFLLGSNVLGDPRSVFVVSLKNIKGPLYSMVREKIERESGQIAQGLMPGAPSCIDSYSSATRPETAERVAKILSAQLEDEELREKARQEGALPPALSVAAELMRNSSTVFFGRRLGCISGFFPKLPADEKTPPPRKTPGFTRESGRMG